MDATLKLTIRANVRALLRLTDKEAGIAALIRLGLSNGNAQRVFDDTTQLKLDRLQQLADALHVKPWQLLVPELDPDNLPSLERVEFRWPFRQIDPEVVTGLFGSAAQGVENGLLASLATLGISPRKRHNRAA